MDEQNRDDFYEGPPLEDPERWHDGAVVESSTEGAEAHERADAQREPIDAQRRPLEETPLPEVGPYPLPDVVERPHTDRAGLEPTALTRDASLSRAVDRAAAGMDPEAAGYDRSIEGPPPGPLEPSAEQVPADSEHGPGGEYGSSG